RRLRPRPLRAAGLALPARETGSGCAFWADATIGHPVRNQSTRLPHAAEHRWGTGADPHLRVRRAPDGAFGFHGRAAHVGGAGGPNGLRGADPRGPRGRARVPIRVGTVLLRPP